MPAANDPHPHADIYQLVQAIPVGRVSTYGRIAELTSVPRGARRVGFALRMLRPEQERVVPWWRVINAAGRISNPYNPALQRTLLEAEGIEFTEQGCVLLERYLWEPPFELLLPNTEQ